MCSGVDGVHKSTCAITHSEREWLWLTVRDDMMLDF